MRPERHQPRAAISAAGLDYLDNFDDLNWEREMVQQRRQQRRGHRPVNLTARIEDYLRSYS